MSVRGVVLRLLPTLVVVVVVAAALQELGWPRFDACYHVEYDIYVPDPELGYGFRPGADVQGAIVNAAGLRGPVPSQDKAADVFRVLTVGDSTAWGLGVKEREAFAALAPRLLADQLPGRRVEHLIGALPGYSSWQSRVLLERLLPARPDLVVFYVGARNDLSRASYYRDDEIPERMARRRSAWHRVKLLLAAENLVDFFHKEVVVKLRAKRDRARVPLADFRENVRVMLRETRAAGARALVVVPPWSASLLEDYPFLVGYRDALEELADEAGVPALRLQPLFTAHPEDEVYLPDRLHFAPAGHRLAAEAIRDAVVRAGLLPQRAAPAPSASRAPAPPAARRPPPAAGGRRMVRWGACALRHGAGSRGSRGPQRSSRRSPQAAAARAAARRSSWARASRRASSRSRCPRAARTTWACGRERACCSASSRTAWSTTSARPA